MQGEKQLDRSKFVGGVLSPPMADRDHLDRKSAARLQRLREALGLSQKEMAAKIGVTYRVWNNWECGYPVPRDGARRIKERIRGVDLDFILDGDEDDLSPSIRKALSELPNDA
jgi:transcriptional regulator with XRE-family HTH domain